MKLLIATPTYHIDISVFYVQALLRTTMHLQQRGISHAWYPLPLESPISHARNKCAKEALEGGYDKLLFIDSDMIWTPEMVTRLLDSPHAIVGGTYPMKALPVTPNLNPLDEHIKDYGIKRSLGAFMDYRDKYANDEGEVEVRHVPTGFLMIDCSVFKKMEETRLKYTRRDAVRDELTEYCDFFPMRITEEERMGHKFVNFETEDWGFCTEAKKLGYKIWLNTKCITQHIGYHIYKI